MHEVFLLVMKGARRVMRELILYNNATDELRKGGSDGHVRYGTVR